MSEFKRRRGETTAAWCARLGAVDMAPLSAAQLDDLTLRRVLAAQTVRREVRRQHAAADELHGNGAESKALRRCKTAVHALSDDERRLLRQWLDAAFDD